MTPSNPLPPARPSGAVATSATPPWVATLDGVLDGSLVAFALWTLWYEVALVTQWSLWWPARLWIPVAVLMVTWCALRARRASSAQSEAPARRPVSDPRTAAPRAALLVGSGVVLVALAAPRGTIGVTPLAVVAVALLVGREVPRLRELRGPRADPDPDTRPVGPAPGPRSHATAALCCVALAVLGSLLVKFDADDAYYVNRATWVAQHGTPTLKDTMFSPGTLPSAYIGGPPLPSIEALQGGIAHVLGLAAPSVAYVLTVPVVAALAGWALWRLVRDWASASHLAVHCLALLFLVLSGGSIWGNYFVGRAWQGKVVAVVVVLPLVWLHLGRLARGRCPHSARMLAVCGLAFVGLTSTAALLAPVIAVAALLSACLLRARHLAVGAVAFLLAPLGAGLVAASSPSGVGGDQPPMSATDAVTVVLGPFLGLTALALLALVFSPGLVRGPAGVVAATGSLATLVAVLPGVFGLVNAVTGAGPVIWRLLIGPPTAVLVGMLVTWPFAGRTPSGLRAAPSRGRGPAMYAAAATAVLLAVVMVAAGTPIWSASVGADLTAAPRWKLPPTALADVRALTRLESASPRTGLWLLPETQSEVLSATSTTSTAVVARSFYLNDLPVDPEAVADRSRLYGFVGGVPLPVAKVRRALKRLDVSVACLPGDASPRTRRTLARATGSEARPVGTMLCHLPGSSQGGEGTA